MLNQCRNLAKYPKTKVISDVLICWAYDCLFSLVPRKVVDLAVGKVSGDFDVWAFGDFQMVGRFCHEAGMDCQVVVGN